MLLRLIDQFNPWVIRLLRSPFHWLMSPGLTLVTFTGRKSGRQYTTPVGYHRFDDVVVIMVSDADNRQWWRNFRQAAPIELTLRGRSVKGIAEVLTTDSQEFKQRAEACFKRAGFIPRIFGIHFKPAIGLTPEQIQHLGDYARIVRVSLVSAQPLS